MAGPLTIQRVPRGLIELLGMKATGEVPAQLAQDIVGTVELTNAYMFDRQQLVRASTAVAVAGIGNYVFLSMTVPSGFQWIVHSLAVECFTIAAASSIRITAVANRGSGNVRQALTDPISIAASEGTMFGRTFETPLMLGPGDSLGVYCSAITGAPGLTPTGMLVYTPIGI